jgi:hypothetical protein
VNCPNVALRSRYKSLQAMLLAEKDLEQDEVSAIAVAVYAIARTVQALRNNDCVPAPLLKLHLQEGARGRTCTSSAKIPCTVP